MSDEDIRRSSSSAAVTLVHGAWHGGWAWHEVAGRLRSQGRQVDVVDLPGSDGTAGVTLEDQVTAVVGALGRQPRLVVAHSFGGIVARAAAARAPERVAELVLVDGWVVDDGQSFFDVMPPAMRGYCQRVAFGEGDERLIPAPPPSSFGVTEEPARSWLQTRLTPQPWATFADPCRYDSAAARGVPGRAVTCLPSTLPFTEMAERLGYPVTSIRSGHDAMLLDPEALSLLL